MRACMTIVFESNEPQHDCPNCGAYLLLPSSISAYEPQGVARTIEQVLFETGHSAHLARRGVDKWAIQQGSAKIILTYHEDSGLIMSDAYLCWLPEENKLPLYEFLLLENESMEGLTFSIKPKSREIVLSLLIFEQYFNVPTGVALFRYLFEKADFFDNILVEEYGAMWRNHKKFEKES
ncbi:MAG: YbjN domain-containing protein [Saprospiraceae bacterium]|nr:YbjN domain-containing protein [Saprospiraceae bacterium]